MIRDTHFTLRTDHKNLTFLNQEHRGKVQRWKIAIQEYDFDIEFLPGTLNVVADGFSRLVSVDPLDKPIMEELNILLNEFTIPEHRYNQIAQVHNMSVGHHGVNRTCDTNYINSIYIGPINANMSHDSYKSVLLSEDVTIQDPYTFTTLHYWYIQYHGEGECGCLWSISKRRLR